MHIGYNYNMKLENEDALDKFIICSHCYTLHEEIPLESGTKACCTQCKNVLYEQDNNLLEKGMALSISALIFFIIANLFPLVKVEILGHQQYITITKTVFGLFESDFYIVGIIVTFMILLFPIIIMSIYFLFFYLLKNRMGEELSAKLLVILSKIIPWSMMDIFLVSILVALVKLIGYAQIHIGISFWALIAFVFLDIYLTKSIKMVNLWMLRKDIFLQKESH